MKRMLDIVCSFFGLVLLSPLLIPVMLLIWRQDRHSPLYIAPRVGKDSKIFKMFKLRSMVADADKTGVDSTSAGDSRITPIGHFVRKFKLDEFTQLWNVLKGDMSLVGPRPNVKKETDLYTDVEKGLLSIKPGITDFSSVVFSDENEILKESKDPDIDYNQLIRPWKSRLGLLYAKHQSFLLDCVLVLLTVVALVSREKALCGVNRLLKWLDAPADVIRVSKREDMLVPTSPPGSESIVTTR
ncbi:MAG: sugar transferase [Deltaproteobacteria bacterium]|nr:sugar transferase [Deltaproteobacteria bacterium]MBW2662081.1 sugar transferase [Deltaproteobacteria bacterium]